MADLWGMEATQGITGITMEAALRPMDSAEAGAPEPLVMARVIMQVKIEAGVTISPIRTVQRGTFLKTSADSNDRVTITLTGFSDANKMIAILNSANEPGSDNPDSGCYLYSLDSDSISIQMTEYSDSSAQGGSYQVIEFK